MNRSTKERLIGAIVLVALAVLIVPVFLDGPSDDAAMISERVALPGQNDQPRRRQTIVLERDRQQPVPAAVESLPLPSTIPTETRSDDGAEEANPVAADEENSKPSSDNDSAAEPAQSDPASVAVATIPDQENEQQHEAQPEEAPAAQPSGPEVSETGLWAVQLGSFSSKGNAEVLAAELRREGYAAFLSRVDTASGELHRVRIGPQKDRRAAAGVARNLASAGHNGQVVTHP